MQFFVLILMHILIRMSSKNSLVYEHEKFIILIINYNHCIE